MADRDHWGEQVLRQYKSKPWVLRQNSNHNDVNSFSLVQIVIKKEMRDFDDTHLQILRYALAKFLDVAPESIKVVARKTGSVKLLLECPPEAATQLKKAFNNKREELQSRLPLFPITDVDAVLSGEIAVIDVMDTPVESELIELAKKALSHLPPRQREFIEMDLVELRPQDEICLELGISPSQYLKLKVETFSNLKAIIQAMWGQEKEAQNPEPAADG